MLIMKWEYAAGWDKEMFFLGVVFVRRADRRRQAGWRAHLANVATAVVAAVVAAVLPADMRVYTA